MLPCRIRGFTLLEIAIVLAVIAVITGSIMLGQEVVRNSRLQSIGADVANYKNAIKLFHDQYKYFPGDMPTATDFWGTDAACPNTPANHEPKKATCNGNGNGVIAYGDNVDLTTDATEAWRAWQQMANAGLIAGELNGTGSSLTTKQEAGLNMPASRFAKGAGFSLAYTPAGTYASSYASTYGHVIVFGRANQNMNQHATGAMLTGREAQLVDQKSDDGEPSTGNTLSYTPAYRANCANGASPPAYNLGNQTSATCALIFITGL